MNWHKEVQKLLDSSDWSELRCRRNEGEEQGKKNNGKAIIKLLFYDWQIFV